MYLPTYVYLCKLNLNLQITKKLHYFAFHFLLEWLLLEAKNLKHSGDLQNWKQEIAL